MFFKIYKSSVAAAFVSICGAGFVYGAIVCLFTAAILPAIICGVVGVFLHSTAANMGEKAAFKKWTKKLAEAGYSQRIAQGDYALAVQIYNENPKEETVKYVASLNAGLASRLRAAIEASKAAK